MLPRRSRATRSGSFDTGSFSMSLWRPAQHRQRGACCARSTQFILPLQAQSRPFPDSWSDPRSDLVPQDFQTCIAGSLPKPAWLSETHKLWPQWKVQGPELAQAKLDATLLWVKAQEDAGLSIIGDGEQSRQHFVHGFLECVEGIDFEHKVTMGIRDGR